jgi:hypothetical protein
MVKLSENSYELAPDEVRAILDREARARLGISADELLRVYRSGTLDRIADVADLLILMDLLEEPVSA